MDEQNEKGEPVKIDKGRTFRLWIGMLLPPTVWALQLQTLYLTSEYGCWASDFVWNHVVSVTALVFSIAGGIVAWREWQACGGGTDDDDATLADRRRFMAIIGLLSGGLFTAAIFAQWLPTLMGVPCGK